MKFAGLRAPSPVWAPKSAPDRRRAVFTPRLYRYHRRCAENDAIRQIAVTTNGYRLERDVASWRDAGLTGINVSVDSLDARQFHAITGQDKFNQVMAGIDAAFEAGFEGQSQYRADA